ncbi:MAG: imidazoleglycerol-phosphate dehydratase HisB [bacterium]
MKSRSAHKKRGTQETSVEIALEIDGQGKYNINTSIPFLDHMLSLMAKHGFFNLNITAQGDIQVDFHHTVEDIGIVLGDVFTAALGDKKGMKRYGTAVVPMDEALAEVNLDICSRPYLGFHVRMLKGKVGEFDLELVEEFFKAFTNHSGMTIHVTLKHGENHHHCIEAIFKALGRALDQATMIDNRIESVLSTKGEL